jgi:hypothetical protein
MLALFAAVSAWPAIAAERRRLAGLALAGMIACGAASAVAAALGGGLDLAHDPAHGWTTLLIAAAVTAALAWAWTARRPDGRALSVATAATAAALIAGSVVREAPRLALIERPGATAVDAGGLPVFAITLAIGAAAIAWVVRTVRSA